MPLNIVLFGPPGAGKSTQAARLCEQFPLQAISTGQKLRETVAAGAPLGAEVAAVMAAGRLVDDSLMTRLLREWIAAIPADHGVLLDGFPRTVAQAEMLSGLLAEVGRSLDRAIALVLSDDEAVRRLSGRRMCRLPSGQETIVHIADADAIASCTAAGGSLIERPDDAPEAIKRRMAEYNAKTEPLLQWFGNHDVLALVDADGPPATVGADLGAIIAALPPA